MTEQIPMAVFSQGINPVPSDYDAFKKALNINIHKSVPEQSTQEPSKVFLGITKFKELTNAKKEAVAKKVIDLLEEKVNATLSKIEGNNITHIEESTISIALSLKHAMDMFDLELPRIVSSDTMRNYFSDVANAATKISGARIYSNFISKTMEAEDWQIEFGFSSSRYDY